MPSNEMTTTEPKYLTADDIAAELQLSRTRAYEVMRECARIVTGRSVRVSRAAFEAWKRRHEEAPALLARLAPPLRFPGPTRMAATSAEASPSRMPIVPRTKPRAAAEV